MPTLKYSVDGIISVIVKFILFFLNCDLLLVAATFGYLKAQRIVSLTNNQRSFWRSGPKPQYGLNPHLILFSITDKMPVPQYLIYEFASFGLLLVLIRLAELSTHRKQHIRLSHCTNSEKSEQFLKLAAADLDRSTTVKKVSLSAH